MFDWMRTKKTSTPAAAPREYVIDPQVSLLDLAPTPAQEVKVPQLIVPAVASNVLLKRLKWVDYQGKVAIVTALDSSGYAKIDFVDAAGITVGSERVNAGNLRLARYLQIPPNRRQGISPAYAAALGYV